MEDEFTLMDAFRVLARRWKLIVAVTRFKKGMDDLRRAILLIEGKLPEVTAASADQGGAPVVVRKPVP